MKIINTKTELLAITAGNYLLVEKAICFHNSPEPRPSRSVGRIQIDTDGEKELVTVAVLEPVIPNDASQSEVEDLITNCGCDIPLLDCDLAMKDLGIEQSMPLNRAYLLDEDEVIEYVVVEIL